MNRPRRLYLIVVALVTMVQGLRLLTGYRADYPDSVYKFTFQVLSFTAWGWIFSIIGVIMLIVRRHGVMAYMSYAIASIVWAIWAGCLWVSVPERAGVVQPTGYAALCIVGAYALHDSYIKSA